MCQKHHAATCHYNDSNSCDHAHFFYGNAEGPGSSETLVTSYQTTRTRIEDGSDFCFWISEQFPLFCYDIGF